MQLLPLVPLLLLRLTKVSLLCTVLSAAALGPAARLLTQEAPPLPTLARHSPLLFLDRLQALVSRVQAIQAPAKDFVLMPLPQDIEADPLCFRLRLQQWHRGADFAWIRPGTGGIQAPFRGLKRISGKSLELELRPLVGVPGVLVLLRGVQARGSHFVLDPAAQAAMQGQPPTVDPAAPAAWRALAERSRALDYEKGPFVEVELQGLEAYLGCHMTPRERLWLLWQVLLPAFVRRSAALSPDPGSGLRGLENFLARKQKREAPSPFDSSMLEGLPPLGFFRWEGKQLTPTRLEKGGFLPSAAPEEARIWDRLFRRLLARLRWPLAAAGVESRYLRSDDGWGRGGLGSHPALDLGAGLFDPTRGFLQLGPGSPVLSPCEGSKPWPHSPPGSLAYVAEEREGPYLLRVLISLWHLSTKGERTLPRLEARNPSEPSQAWRSAAPLYRALGLRKGLHCHFECLGLLDSAPARKQLLFQTLLPVRLLESSGVPGAPKPKRQAPSSHPATRQLPIQSSAEPWGSRPTPALLTEAFRALRPLPLLPSSKGWLRVPGPLPLPSTWTRNAQFAELFLRARGRPLFRLRIRGVQNAPTLGSTRVPALRLVPGLQPYSARGVRSPSHALLDQKLADALIQELGPRLLFWRESPAPR